MHDFRSHSYFSELATQYGKAQLSNQLSFEDYLVYSVITDSMVLFNILFKRYSFYSEGCKETCHFVEYTNQDITLFYDGRSNTVLYYT